MIATFDEIDFIPRAIDTLSAPSLKITRDGFESTVADTQPGELRALRELAASWMGRLAEFRPHLTGAVWRGTATRLSNVHLQLYCDDSKATEIALLNTSLPRALP